MLLATVSGLPLPAFFAAVAAHAQKRPLYPRDVAMLHGAVARLKMRDVKMRDQIAGVETAGKVSMESQRVKKCLKVVVFVCRVIPSV